jgi:MSHA biogenesis protein MshK
VQVGDRVQGARVTRIGDNEVELARGAERQVLRLYAQDESGGMSPAGRTPGR